MNKTIIILIVVILLIVGVFWYFDRGGEVIAPENGIAEEESSEAEGEEVAVSEVVNDEEVEEVREISVSGDEFSFSPSNIEVESGERVRIVFSNDGNMNHDLRIEELNIGTRIIASGQTDSFEFTAPEAGTYTVYCSLPGHRSNGMEGVMIVN